MSQPQSKTEQLIYRNSYRKHKERLSDIKHNQTAKDFHLPKRPDDKKGFLRTKVKQEEIQHENIMLKDKIASMKGKTFYEPPLVSLTEQLRNQVRYNEDSKLDLKEDFDDGEPVRCIIPSGRTRMPSFQPKSKLQATSYLPYKVKYVGSAQKRPQSYHKNNHNADRAYSQARQRQNQMLYHLPERNEMRQVFHNKTVILSPSQSCLYEIAMIADRMLITARIMGLESYCLTELLSVKMTRMLMKQYENNYEELYSRIVLEEGNMRYKAIKVAPKEVDTEPKDRSNDDDAKMTKIRAQNSFLQRNYYTQMKKDEESRSEESGSKPTITHDKLQDLMDRLAVPTKRYNRDNVTPAETIKHKYFQQSKLSIHVDSKATEQRKVNMHKQEEAKGTNQSTAVTKRYTPVKSTPVVHEKLKQTESIEVDKSYQSKSKEKEKEKEPSILDSVVSSRKNSKEQQSEKEATKKEKEDEEQVEYLDGEDEYQESFENPSSISKDKMANKSGLSQSGKNNSMVSKKHQKNDSKNYEDINEAYENEEYEPMFESGQKSMPPKPKEGKAKPAESAPVEEDEYAEEFQA